MHTYSHVLQTVWLRSVLATRGCNPHASFVLGSFLPDMPLMLLTAWYGIRRRLDLGSGAPFFGADYDALFFGDPVWLIGHNSMHAPPTIAAGLALGWWLGLGGGRRGWAVLFWFAAGCGLHSIFDIATHHHDGPLLLFPFDLETRFASPVSYWDSRHYAKVLLPIEHAIDLAIGAWMLGKWFPLWLRRLQSRRSSRQTD